MLSNDEVTIKSNILALQLLPAFRLYRCVLYTQRVNLVAWLHFSYSCDPVKYNSLSNDRYGVLAAFSKMPTEDFRFTWVSFAS